MYAFIGYLPMKAYNLHYALDGKEVIGHDRAKCFFL